MRRSGTILIIVAGICALLASLTLAFILRTRASVEETAAFEADVQARIMLIAACSYVCEASRIGYEPLVNDPANGNNHVEAYGWVDVRDGSPGPNTRNYRTSATSPSVQSQELEILPLWGSSSGGAPTSTTPIPTGLPAPNDTRPNWPEINSVARCPLFRMNRPPFALEMTVIYNDISKTNDLTYLKNPDPRPLSSNLAPYVAGDKNPIQQTLGRCWFRVYRDTASTFVITVGAGSTLGFRDYREVVATGDAAQFNNDALYFNTLLAQEFRMWYRIEWSPAVGGALNHNLLSSYSGWDTMGQFYMSSSGKFALHPMNTSHVTYPFTNQEGEIGSQSHPMNQGGTIRWVQRLKSPPILW